MEQFLVNQVKVSDLKCGDEFYAHGEWTKIAIIELIESMKANYPDDIFLVKLPSPDILIPSEPDIEAWVKEHGYYGTCTSEWHEGLEEGAKWALTSLKELNPNLNFKSK